MKDNRQVVLLNLSDILPNRFQPRIKFDESKIIELSESIKEHGVIQPIIVRKISDKYEIIAGERRYKASIMAGKDKIPAIIVELNDKDSSEIALIENVQRQDLTPIEEAISYRKILDMGYLTQEALATKLGVAQSTIANKLRLLNLDDEVQEALLDGKISERHARSLLRLSKSVAQREVLNKIITERLTVRKTDEVISNMMNEKNETVLDSLEKGMPVQNYQTSVSTSSEENPFMINNDENNDNIINPNVEVLDFGFEEIKTESNEEVNVPTNPIVEDEQMEHQPENIFSTPINLDEENKIDDYNMVQDTTSPSIEEESSDEKIDSEIIEEPTPTTGNRFFTMVAPEFEENTVEEVPTPQAIFKEEINETEGAKEEAPTLAEVVPPSNENSTENIFTTMPTFDTQVAPIDINIATNFDTTSNKIEEQEIEPPKEQVITPLETETFMMEEQPSLESIPQVQMEVEQPSVSTLRDVINKMRKCADEIENMGFEIDTEEFDFDDIYQVIFKIKK